MKRTKLKASILYPPRQGEGKVFFRRGMAAGGSVAAGNRRRMRIGQSAVEFALIAPVLTLMLVAMADFARVFYTTVEVYNAASAGVNYGAQNTTTMSDYTGMQNAAKNDGANLTALTATASSYCTCPSTPNTQFTCPASASCSDQRRYVKVVTSATYTTLLNYPGIQHSISISGSAVMRAQ